MWGRFSKAFLEIVCHTVLVLTLLGAFWVVEKSLYYLWGPNQKVLWGVVEIRYLFDTADAAVLVSFFISGLWNAIRAYNGWDG